MFQPFENASQFYPGLIIWCDPNSYDMEATTLPPNTTYDRKKMRELRPCLVVAVNQATQMLQVTRLCATVPTDPRRWVRVDSQPSITWKHPDAWIWVGTPSTIKMVLNYAKAMHPHKDVQYTTPQIATANLQNYWIHRQNYLNQGPSTSASAYPTHGGASTYNTTPYPGSTVYSSNPNTPLQSPSTPTHSNMFNAPAMSMYNPNTNTNPGANPAYPQSGHGQGYFGYVSNMNMNTMNHAQHGQQGFNTLAPQPVVVPAGFTETHSSAPGWWRNPETGWFWHAARGLLPPAAMRGPGGPPAPE